MSDTHTEPAATSAYDLLTRPTLELTDAEVEAIVQDLRKRRAAYVADPKKGADKPKAKPAAKSPDEVAAARAAALADLGLDLGI